MTRSERWVWRTVYVLAPLVLAYDLAVMLRWV